MKFRLLKRQEIILYDEGLKISRLNKNVDAVITDFSTFSYGIQEVCIAAYERILFLCNFALR